MYSVTSVQYRRNLALAVALAGAVGDGGADSGSSTPAETVEDLEEAFNSEEPEVAVTVAQDMEVAGEKALVVAPGKTVTLTIPEGVTLSGGNISDSATGDATIVVQTGGTLVLNGEGTIAGGDDQYCAIKMTANNNGYDATQKAKVVINGGKYVGKMAAISGNGKRKNTEVEINGGEFESTDPKGTVIFNPQGESKVKITGGTFRGAMCIVHKSGDLEITGGSFEATGSATEYKPSTNGWTATGDCVMVDNAGYPGGAPTANITGGTFKSANGKAFGSYAGGQGLEPITAFVTQSGVTVQEATASDVSVYKA